MKYYCDIKCTRRIIVKLFASIKNGEKRFSRESLPPPPPPPPHPTLDDKLGLSSVKVSQQKDAQKGQYSINQKQTKYGSLNFRFLRSRSMSRNRETKVFPTTNQTQLKPVSAFEATQNDSTKNKEIGMKLGSENNIDRSKPQIATINRRRFSSSLYDELLKAKSGDDTLRVGIKMIHVMCLNLWFACIVKQSKFVASLFFL